MNLPIAAADAGLTRALCDACTGYDMAGRIAALEAALAYHLAILPLAERDALLASQAARLRRTVVLIRRPAEGMA